MNASQVGPASGRRRRARRCWPATLPLLLLPFLLAALAPVSGLGADAAPWRIERGEVRISVPLRPGGTFEAKTKALRARLQPGGSMPVLLTGEIAVDLTTIDTGIELRNRHLRENYLEVAKGPGFDTAVLSKIRVTGAASEAFRGHSGFTATLLLHGVKGSVSGLCEIRPAPTGVLVQANFSLGLRDFGIEPPQYLGVGVGNELLVKVAFSAAPSREAGQ